MEVAATVTISTLEAAGVAADGSEAVDFGLDFLKPRCRGDEDCESIVTSCEAERFEVTEVLKIRIANTSVRIRSTDPLHFLV